MNSSLTSIGFCFLSFFLNISPPAKPDFSSLLPYSSLPETGKTRKPASLHLSNHSFSPIFHHLPGNKKQTNKLTTGGGGVLYPVVAKRDIFLIFVVPVFPASDEWENMGNITGGKHCGNLSGLSASLSTLSSLLPQPCFSLSFILQNEPFA